MPNKKISTKKPKELQKTKNICTRRERLHKHRNELSRCNGPKLETNQMRCLQMKLGMNSLDASPQAGDQSNKAHK